uniref:Ig-like domain-containing protein n=1 Tax=Neolamprologus brichardi TaxID=32507 RepID=A0A3Q4GH62_NEOBR
MKTPRASACGEISRLPVLLLVLLSGACGAVTPAVTLFALVEVKGHTGQDVTLPCKYDRKYYGALSVCWQRGEIPLRGCSNQLISTDGLRVETRAPSRYELLGRLEDGDVSLTIKMKGGHDKPHKCDGRRRTTRSSSETEGWLSPALASEESGRADDICMF